MGSIRDLPTFVKRALESRHGAVTRRSKRLELAESGQQGPVLVDVPMKSLGKITELSRDGRQRTQNQASRIDKDTAVAIVEALVEADNPVLYVGGGILLSRASAELQAFVDHMGVPVAHSLMGKGALSDDHPLVLGMTGFWGTSLVNQKTMGADVVLAIGTRFKEADSSCLSGLHLDYRRLALTSHRPSEIGRNVPTG